jgi:integrase
LGAISAQVVQRWQNELERRASHNLTMACRSILNRILEAAEGERLIPVDPVRKVRVPKRPVDPEVVFGRVRRRAYTPEELGRFLVGCPMFYRDHFIVQVGTGLRSGELLGLRSPAGRPGDPADRGRGGPLRRRQVRLGLQGPAQERRQHPAGADGRPGGRGDGPAPGRLRP